MHRPQAVKAFGVRYGEGRVKVLWYAIGVAAILFIFVIAAFDVLLLVVVAYVGAVGWVVLAFTVVSAILVYAAMIWQSPVQQSRTQLRFRREGQGGFEGHSGSGDDGGNLQQNVGAMSVSKVRAKRSEQEQAQEEVGYGKSTSGDHGQRGGYGPSGRRVSRRDEGFRRERHIRPVL